ncbi:ribosomal RNA large subunit methyltransferase J [Ephemerocybe angulata]|uniref:rRNA methyltransferase 2, mitochondrial n=1 Tax=Ephemerocybe angulata TaxID=980116 RepID=A0A8H6HM45_9AGAR|nr:ribosomal RNA large subunit methyltransferase J [Tulosesus angulatus]
MPFRATRTCLGKASSNQWLSRQFRDPYVKKRLADPATYRSRSAFKLLEIESSWDNFLTKKDVRAVVDLGAAPGGWSQVVAGKLGFRPDGIIPPRGDSKARYEQWSTAPVQPSGTKNSSFDPLNIDDVISAEQNQRRSQGRGTIIAVDLLRMEPIHGVHSLVGNFLEPETSVLIRGLLEANGCPDGKVDVILSDMAANATGNEDADVQSSLRICEAVLEFAKKHLRSAQSIGRTKGGVLLMKYFAHPELDKFRREKLQPNFQLVKNLKPTSSRAESSETYFMCQGWKPSRPTPSKNTTLV